MRQEYIPFIPTSMPSGLTVDRVGQHECHHSFEHANKVLWAGMLKCLGKLLAHHFGASLHRLHSYLLARSILKYTQPTASYQLGLSSQPQAM